MEELERLPADRTSFYINLFNVPANASQEQLWLAFGDFQIDDFIPNKALPNVYDLKVESRETFRQIVSNPKYFVGGKPVYFRFSGITRQPQHSD
jgi:hypothetical protein